jgi:hypothetical protein
LPILTFVKDLYLIGGLGAPLLFKDDVSIVPGFCLDYKLLEQCWLEVVDLSRFSLSTSIIKGSVFF